MKFKTTTITGANEFLQYGLRAEEYVASFLKEDSDGMYSDELTGASRHNLYVGTAGILHMYVELHQVTDNEEYKTKITEIARYLDRHVFAGVEAAKRDGEFVPGMAEAFYSGIGGIGLALNEVYRLYKDENARHGAGQIIDYYFKHAVKTDEGIYWSGNCPVFFDGGIALFLVDSYYTYGSAKDNTKQDISPKNGDGCSKTDTSIGDKLRSYITGAADYILAHAIKHGEGALEFDRINVDFKHKEPNFEFGTAGVGYLMAQVYVLTGDRKYLEAAFAAANYIKSIAVKQKKGYLIPYKLGRYDDKFYLGNCHGPVGTAKLFYELYSIMKNPEWLQEVRELIDGAESLGAPFAMSWGFWNTTCVCCGPAGYMPLFIAMYRETGEDKWKELAHRVGEVLVGSGSVSGTVSSESGAAENISGTFSDDNGSGKFAWEIAFDRTAPDKLTRPAGYFTGAAGMIVMLLELYCLETGKSGVRSFIDDPYRK